MENVFCLFLLFVLLCSVCVVIKALHAEGDGDFQKPPCFIRATTVEISNAEVWLYHTELA